MEFSDSIAALSTSFDLFHARNYIIVSHRMKLELNLPEPDRKK